MVDNRGWAGYGKEEGSIASGMIILVM